MPVTIRSAVHTPRKWEGSKLVRSPQDLFHKSCPTESRRCKSIIQSSFSDFPVDAPIAPSSNGFVRASIAAYCSHHHLTIRPEDVWFAILTQFGFFVNGNAEEVRSFFVSHKGQEELEVVEIGTIHSVDFGLLARRMTKMIAKNVNDPELRTWIMPKFSTTTESDRVVASILMMGAMQKYFTYSFCLACGIPSVTLLGVRSDWEEIQNRLEMLPRLGPEPAQFCALLKPILHYFVMSFDTPTAPAVLDFWSKIAHKTNGSGTSYISGWITAFCFWNVDGKCLYTPRPLNPNCDLDGALNHTVDMDNISAGHASVPVKVDDNGVIYKTRMVAGSVGIQVTSSGDILDEGWDHNGTSFTYGRDGKLIPHVMVPQPGQVSGPDSLQPVSGWWMYELAKGAE